MMRRVGRTLRAALAACAVAAPLALALTPMPARAQAAAPADPAPEQPPPQQDELYQEALRALDAGRAEDGNELLLRFLEKQPRHAGAWLELALSQCGLGRAEEAERLFKQIETRFSPPPGIREVIEVQRLQGCRIPPPPPREQWSVTTSRGYDSNVNQGASNATFRTGNGDNELEWQLGPEYLPKADHYAQMTVDYSRRLNDDGLLAFGQLRARRNDHVHLQDTITLLAGLEQAWRLGAWRGRGTAAFSALRLDDQYYQRQVQLQARVTPPLGLPEWLDFSLSSGLNHVTYPTRIKYDSNTVELGANLRYLGKQTFSQVAVGVLSDRGQTGRLGGDRVGWYGSVFADFPISERLSAQAGGSRQIWRSSDMYSPGLIDIARHQDTQQVNATAIWRLQPHHSLLLEWRATRNRENIGLFQYNSRVVQLSWRWDNY